MIGRLDVFELAFQPGGGERAADFGEVRPVLRAEPAGGAEPARRRGRHFPQTDERLREGVQPLLRGDAGEVADGVRRLGALGARAAVAFEAQPGVDGRDLFARQAEIRGHEVGVERARGDEAVNGFDVLAD